MVESDAAENPAVTLLRARNVRAVGADPKQKVAAPLLTMVLLVRTAAIPVCASAYMVSSSLRLAAVTAEGPSIRSVPITKSVIGSNEESRELLRVRRKVSVPAPPINTSAPAPPIRVSLPPSPIRVSLPARPVGVLLAELPVMILPRSLPVPDTTLVPVRVGF